MKKYSEYAETPIEILENLDLTNNELFDIVKKYEPNMQTEEVHKEIMLANEMDRMTENLRHFLGESESELSLNIKKLTTNAKFVFSTLYLACECQDQITIDRILSIFVVLGETLHIKLNSHIVKTLARIFNAYPSKDTITIGTFFKNLRMHIKRIFPDYFLPLNKEVFDNVEMHENLLLNSQTFKNFIDEDEERDLAYTSFRIGTMYSRGKSGRPMTSKHNHGDKGEFNNLDDIPESKNEMIDKDGLLDGGNTSGGRGKKGQKNDENFKKLGTKDDVKNTTKDTGEVVNPNEGIMQTDINQGDNEKHEGRLDTNQLDGSPERNVNDSQDNPNINSQEFRQGTAIDENKMSDDIHVEESQGKQQTEEGKHVQQTDDTVINYNTF